MKLILSISKIFLISGILRDSIFNNCIASPLPLVGEARLAHDNLLYLLAKNTTSTNGKQTETEESGKKKTCPVTTTTTAFAVSTDALASDYGNGGKSDDLTATQLSSLAWLWTMVVFVISLELLFLCLIFICNDNTQRQFARRFWAIGSPATELRLMKQGEEEEQDSFAVQVSAGATVGNKLNTVTSKLHGETVL